MIVIGGAIGSYAAKVCAKKCDVSLIEEHRPEDQKVSCSGLLSKSGLSKINVSGDFVLNKIKGAKFFSAHNNFEVRSRDVKAYVVDRKKFDNSLLYNALDSGVEVVYDYVSDINQTKEGFEILTKKNNCFKTDKVVLATGTNYSLHRKLNFKICKFLVSCQYEMPLECEPDMVELHFIVPEFFAWVIPAGDYARVGIACYNNPEQKLKNFIKILNKKRKAGEIINKSYGIIPIHDPRIKTDYGNIRLVGDAASQVKATTGGGIITGCIAAKHILDENYEKEWRKEIGRELYIHLLLRKFLNRNYNNIDGIFRIIEKNKEIVEEADMDYASVLVENLIKNAIKKPKLAIDIFKYMVSNFKI